MSQLSIISIIVGSILFLIHLFPAILPDKACVRIKSFPRSVWAGRLITAVDVAWVAVLLSRSGFNWIERYQSFVLPAAVLAFILIVVFVDELLAARALGGLFLLAPMPILDAAFVHPANARLVMTVFAYVLAILGIILVWSPFMFRKMTAGLAARPALARTVGFAGCLVGLGMVLLGIVAYCNYLTWRQ